MWTFLFGYISHMMDYYETFKMCSSIKTKSSQVLIISREIANVIFLSE